MLAVENRNTPGLLFCYSQSRVGRVFRLASAAALCFRLCHGRPRIEHLMLCGTQFGLVTVITLLRVLLSGRRRLAVKNESSRQLDFCRFEVESAAA